MRPKILEIEGLQSYKERQCIDFDALGETGLFGIFGPTGSGKSTVLDAITFALYGKVERAERGTQGIIHASCSRVRVAFTFELLRDNQRRIYRVERVYARKKSSENACEPKIARLVEVSPLQEIPLCDKATDVSNKVEEILGLNHDDFTRAVVLPQNKFQEFLMLDNSKKRAMLERIFYLEEYGRQLNEKLQRRIAVLKNRLANVEGALSTLGDASEKVVAEAKETFSTVQKEKEQVDKELKLLEAQYTEANEVWQYVQDMHLLSIQEEEHDQQQAAVSIKRKELERAVQAEGLMDRVENQQKLSDHLSDTNREMTAVSDRLPHAQQALNTVKDKLQALQQEAAVQGPVLIEQRTRLAQALEIKEEMTGLSDQINTLDSLIKGMKAEMDQKDQAIQQLKLVVAGAVQQLEDKQLLAAACAVEPDYRAALSAGAQLEREAAAAVKQLEGIAGKAAVLHTKMNDLKPGYDSVGQQIHTTHGRLAAVENNISLHEKNKPGDRDSVLKEKQQLNTWQIQFSKLEHRNHYLHELRGKLKTHQDIFQQKEEDLKALAFQREQAAVRCDQCKQQTHRLEGALERHSAFLLSKQLKTGKACPVCGSAHHPAPAAVSGETLEADTLEKELAEARSTLTEAEAAFQKLETQQSVRKEQQQSAVRQIHQLQTEIQTTEKEQMGILAQFPQQLKTNDVNALGRLLGEKNAMADQVLQQLKGWEEQREAQLADRQALRDELAALQLRSEGMAAAIKNLEENGRQLQTEADKLSGEEGTSRKACQQFLEKYKLSSVLDELKRIEACDRRLNRLQTEMEALRKTSKTDSGKLEQMREEWNTLAARHADGMGEEKHLQQMWAHKKQQLLSLAGDADISLQLKEITAKLDNYTEREKAFALQLDEWDKTCSQLAAQKVSLENKQDFYRSNLDKETGILGQAMAEKGFKDITAVRTAALSKEKQQVYAREIDSWDQRSHNLKAQRMILEKKLNNRRITEEEAGHIKQVYQDKVEQREACLTKTEAARTHYNILNEKHKQWMVLDRTFKDLHKQYGMQEQILKLVKGDKGKDNSFVDYIAEERLRYTAAKASETLGYVTQYKYALELDADAGFIIRDNANGGIHRMVSSLSGGETFLTSLSLALALSEQIQLKGQSPLEFFFLDEGFGTLDNQLLDTVIDSLERLSRKERVIGLISHVPELRARISRRLIIEPPTHQGNGSRVRIDKE